MKVLVTGSNGFIGQKIVEKLEELEDSSKIWTLDKNPSERSRHFATRAEEFDRYSEFDVIYHLAAISNPRKCEEKPASAFKANVESTLAILEQINSNQELIFASSAYVYGEGKELQEKDDLSPKNLYGHTKKSSEEIIRYFASKNDNDFDYKIFRLFNIYGPGQPEGFLVPDVIRKCRNRDEIKVDSPKEFISPVYIEDAIEIILKNLPDGTYNVSHKCVSIGSVYRETSKYFDSEVIFSSSQENDKLCGDNSKLSQYKKEWIDIEEGVRRTVKRTELDQE